MQWKDLAKDIAPFAGTLAKLLPFPGAGIAGDLISKALGCDSTPDAVSQALKTDPEAGVKLAKIEADNKAELEQEYTKQLETVNATMQAEAKSEHWAQWFWRPFNGMMFGATMFCNYALPAILNAFAPIFCPTTLVAATATVPMHMISSWVPIIPGQIPEWVFISWGSILGVTAWHRGKAKVAMAKK